MTELITGLKVTHKDDDYLMSGSHGAGDAATTLRDKGADFIANGVMIGQFIENETESTSGYVKTVTESEITVDGIVGTLSYDFVTSGDWTTDQGVEWSDSLVEWNTDDVYKIYKTSVKGSIISSEWTDRSRGWRTDPKNMERGWRKSDIDLDWDGKKIFGPGQPE